MREEEEGGREGWRGKVIQRRSGASQRRQQQRPVHQQQAAMTEAGCSDPSTRCCRLPGPHSCACRPTQSTGSGRAAVRPGSEDVVKGQNQTETKETDRARANRSNERQDLPTEQIPRAWKRPARPRWSRTRRHRSWSPSTPRAHPVGPRTSAASRHSRTGTRPLAGTPGPTRANELRDAHSQVRNAKTLDMMIAERRWRKRERAKHLAVVIAAPASYLAVHVPDSTCVERPALDGAEPAVQLRDFQHACSAQRSNAVSQWT